MAWATSGEVLQALADTLKRDVGDLDASVGRVVVRAMEAARGTITGELGARLLTPAQVDAWGRLHEFSLEQSLFEAEKILRKMFVDKAGDLLKAQDRTEELKTVAVLDAAGVPITVAGASSGVLNVRAAFDAKVAREDRRHGRWWGENYRW